MVQFIFPKNKHFKYYSNDQYNGPPLPFPQINKHSLYISNNHHSVNLHISHIVPTF